MRSLLETALYGALGAAGLSLLHVPAGALVGAMAAVAVASLCGRPTGAPSWMQTVFFVVVGTAVGAAATPDLVHSVASWPVSLAILAASTVAMFGAGYAVFRRFGGCDPTTAFFAAAPGALSAVVVLAQEAGAVMSQVAAAQALRVAVVTAASPFLLTAANVHRGAAPHTAAVHDPLHWLLLIAAALAGWLAAARLKWPSPAFLGPMAASALLHVTGLVALAPPPPLILVSSAGLGAIVGTRFRGVSSMQLVAFFPPALASLTAMAVIGLGSGWVAGQLSGVGPLAGMLAFAPGSMDVLIAISLAAGQSPAYVAAHHTLRLLAVLALMPLLGRRAAKRA